MKKIIITLIISAIVSGCSYFGGSEEVLESTETPTETPTVQITYTPKNYGTLNISMREPKTLNPLLNEDATVDSVLKLIYEPLFKLDDSLKPQPNLAEKIELAPDGLTAVITLKQGMTWSDGESITVNDFMYSLEVLKLHAPETAIYRDAVTNISLFRINDENSVRLTFSRPFGGIGYSMCFPLIPSHHYKNGNADMNPLGNGLYKFESFTSADRLVLSRSRNILNKEPYIDKINAIITPDNQTDLYSYEQSLTDMVTSGLSDWAKYSGRQDTEITEYTTTYFDFIGFNFENPIFQEKKVRLAIAGALPLDNIITNIYSEHADRAVAPVNPNSWLYESGAVVHAYDPDAARAVFEEFAAEQPIRLLVNTENEERVKIAELIRLNLEDVGLTIEIDEISFEEYSKKLDEKDFDMFVGGFNLAPMPDLTFAFHSTQIDGGKNFFSYNNPDMDELLAQAFFSTDDEGYKKALSKIQMHIAEELPCISIAFRKSALLSKSSIKGELKPLFSNIFENIDEWFIVDIE